MCFFADVGKSSVPVVVIQNVPSVVSHIDIFESIVVVVADAYALSPTGDFSESRFFRNVRESSVVIVVIEMIRRRLLPLQRVKYSAVHDENVRPSVVVVVEDR